MHLRLVNARSGSVTRRYAQIVQSYRRDDGMPAHRVLANLGELSDREVDNLRAALRASREGRAIALPDAAPWRARVLASLAYLDVAVALELWRSWELSRLLHRLIPERSAAVRAAEIVAALTIQRCVAPASKLAAQRWFPRTALPELLGVEPERFHNTRIHRALEQLDRVEEPLQEGLARRYRQRDGAFAALFADVSDVWFEGRGCDLAERGPTKEGLHNRRKVNVLLLCNERGYPLRWKVLPGSARDGQALREMVEAVEGLTWAKGVPIVFDRAMGTAGAVARLIASELRFLAAARRSEIASYTEAAPGAALEDLVGSGNEEARRRLMAEASRRVEEAGMQKVDEQLYVLDLGVSTRTMRRAEEDASEKEALDASELEGGAAWLRQARLWRRQIEEKDFASQSQIAASLGVSRARVTQIMNLLRLDEPLQSNVLAGRYGYVPDVALRAIAGLRGAAKQRRALEEHAAAARPMGSAKAPRRPRRAERFEARLRLTLYFNPQMFADQRAQAERRLRAVEESVEEINRRLRRATAPRTREAVYAEVSGKLAAQSLLSVLQIEIDEAPDEKGKGRPEARLLLDKEAWARRRRHDGFVLLVADPELGLDGVELVKLYRAKDAVEKDFQTIKTDLKLRPVFHHTDPKVRAHVTLCMLALLLERTLEHRLRRGAGGPMTAPACFEELASGRLNLVAVGPDETMAYIVTEPNPEQRAILERLRQTRLVDQEAVAARLHPRPAG